MIKKLIPFFVVITVLLITPSLSEALVDDSATIQSLQTIVKTLTTQVAGLQQRLQDVLSVNQFSSAQLPRPSFACGDVDQNGVVDFKDAAAVADYYFHGNSIANFSLADADGSGKVDIYDVVYLVNYTRSNGPVPKCSSVVNPVVFVTPIQLPILYQTLEPSLSQLSQPDAPVVIPVIPNDNPQVVYACGDVDHDGWVDMVDATAINNYIFPGSNSYTGTFDVTLANVNGKESVDVSDVVYLGEWLRNHKFAPNCSNGPLPAQRIPQPPYACGDVDHDGWVGIADTTAIINYIFPTSDSNSGTFDVTLANVDGKESVDIADAVYLGEWLRKHKSAPICGGVNSPTPAPKDYRVLSSSAYDSMKSQLDLISRQLQSLFR